MASAIRSSAGHERPTTRTGAVRTHEHEQLPYSPRTVRIGRFARRLGFKFGAIATTATRPTVYRTVPVLTCPPTTTTHRRHAEA